MEEITKAVATEETAETTERNFDLTSFARAKDKMIATNDRAYNADNWSQYHPCHDRKREYTLKDIQEIIDHGTLESQQKLSRYYFSRDGYYKQIIIHYATLLKYTGLLIPNPKNGKSLSTSHISKRYYSAMDFVENMSLPLFFTECAQRALVDGSYYGLKVDTERDTFSVIDLPSGYARSRFKDTEGNNLVEFDLRYFDTIKDEEAKKAALNAYPKAVKKAYDQFSKKRGNKPNWYFVPSNIGICFPFFDGRPLFLSVIPKTLEYDAAT
jgi:hypothetical protein